ncbi:DgyrCDS8235 [Dimorphilus gyrociliatus]|uniref:DgyrCDS8235 n=1 Tax=Dimorphilus gyrociliatus TaxID=2664684 RepID=A0A7I8VUJ6_9ANNE|nr:DgyrCDS8235 [Dimorphilus gyrociliatus]
MAQVVSPGPNLKANILGFIKDYANHLGKGSKTKDVVQNFINFSMNWLQSEIESSGCYFQITEFLKTNGFHVSSDDKESEDITNDDNFNNNQIVPLATTEICSILTSPNSEISKETLMKFLCQRPHCGLTFASQDLLSEHLYGFKREIICPVCFKPCPEKQERVFQTHLDECFKTNKAEHPEAALYFEIQTQAHKCCKCRKFFINRADMIPHLAICQTGAKIDCNICFKGFRSEINLSVHIEEDHNIHYCCFLCKKVFFYKGHFNMHLFQCHYLRKFWKSKYKCDICRLHLSNLNGLRDHCIKFHNTNDIAFSCMFCSEVTEYHDIATHYIIKHFERVIKQTKGVKKSLKVRPEPEIIDNLDSKKYLQTSIESVNNLSAVMEERDRLMNKIFNSSSLPVVKPVPEPTLDPIPKKSPLLVKRPFYNDDNDFMSHREFEPNINPFATPINKNIISTTSVDVSGKKRRTSGLDLPSITSFLVKPEEPVPANHSADIQYIPGKRPNFSLILVTSFMTYCSIGMTSVTDAVQNFAYGINKNDFQYNEIPNYTMNNSFSQNYEPIEDSYSMSTIATTPTLSAYVMMPETVQETQDSFVEPVQNTFYDAGAITYPPSSLYYCQDCSMSFKEETELENHFRFVHGKEKTICYICKGLFNDKRDCNLHIINEHLAETNLFEETCFCGANFKCCDNFRRHLFMKHYPNGFYCPVCEEEGFFGLKLKTHLLTHSKLECPVCYSQENSPHHYKMHFQVDHPDMDVIVDCTFCSAFVRNSVIDIHYLTKHRRQLSTTKAIVNKPEKSSQQMSSVAEALGNETLSEMLDKKIDDSSLFVSEFYV